MPMSDGLIRMPAVIRLRIMPLGAAGAAGGQSARERAARTVCGLQRIQAGDQAETAGFS